MTLSRKVRLSNKEEALKLLLERLDNRAIYQWIDVHPGDQFFAGIFATTWKQISDDRLVEVFRTGRKYRFTGHGWLEAMGNAGRLESAEFNHRYGKLNRVLKGYVKGRRERELKQIQTVATDAQESDEWIYNILRSGIWKRKRKHGAEVDDGLDWMVVIPIDFGEEIL